MLPAFRRRAFLALLVVASCCPWVDGAPPDDELSELRALSGGYPRAFFFRQAEGFAANQRISYAAWERTFERLMGIQGKVLEEEVPGRSIRNIDFFTRFKKRHPDQLLLLHYNGNGRDPRSLEGRFFAGHWIYYDGAKILADVPAETGETTIRVDRPELFALNVGRYQNSEEDAGLCLLDESGKPDWSRSEQVQVIAIDKRRSTIRVRRAQYGTKPLALPAGRSYAAAHVTEGPWGRRSHLLWYYNYSTECPRDAEGRSCADVHVDELAQRFSPTGELAAFDGLEFDVLAHEHGRGGPVRGLDCDADGRRDDPTGAGLGTYGKGVIDFCRRLRERLGEEELILADGHAIRSQRAFGILNGIESEGWPDLRDSTIEDWSGGLNRHFFWASRGRAPAFNYVNHKFTEAGSAPGQRVQSDVPFRVHRLVLAGAVFTDSAICFSSAPPAARGERLGIWDELRMGTENRLGWLGMPRGPAVRLARTSPDLLTRATGGIGGRRPQLEPRPSPTGAPSRFALRDVPVEGPDLYLSVTASGEPLAGYPASVPRLLWVGIAPPPGLLTREEPPRSGMCLRSNPQAEVELDPASGASVRWQRARRLGGELHDAYFTHPPYQGGTGYTFWWRDVQLDREPVLDFYTGMGERSPARSDGVTFRVAIAPLKGETPTRFLPIFEHVQTASKWLHHRVPLAVLAGRRVRLKFIADCGPANNSTTDHAHWGDVRVLGPGGVEAMTPPARFMGWVDGSPSTSGFYFSDLRSPGVDLELEVEGAGAVTFHSIAAHAYPDVIYREFDGGLVLANPSPRPYVFGIAARFPDAKFRRLRGSPEQDPIANNGEPVGETLTLAGKEGLFLVRVE